MKKDRFDIIFEVVNAIINTLVVLVLVLLMAGICLSECNYMSTISSTKSSIKFEEEVELRENKIYEEGKEYDEYKGIVKDVSILKLDAEIWQAYDELCEEMAD